MQQAVRIRGQILIRVALALLIHCCAAAAPVSAQDVSGTYRVAGSHPANGAYAGDLSVVANAAAADLSWQYAGDSSRNGYALQIDAVLGGVAAEDAEGLGIVLYRVAGGRLEGIWNGYGNHTGSIGAEILVGPAGLEGTYAIELGRNPDNSRYRGEVLIRRTGQTYQVDWSTPRPSYIGTGVLVGDVLVVAYALRKRPGVRAYCMSGPSWLGLTAAGESAEVAAEIVWPASLPPPADQAQRLETLRGDGRVRQCGKATVATLSQTAL